MFSYNRKEELNCLCIHEIFSERIMPLLSFFCGIIFICFAFFTYDNLFFYFTGTCYDDGFRGPHASGITVCTEGCNALHDLIIVIKINPTLIICMLYLINYYNHLYIMTVFVYKCLVFQSFLVISY